MGSSVRQDEKAPFDGLIPSGEAWGKRVLDGTAKGDGYNLLRSVLGGVSSLYGVGLAAYLGAERAGVRRRALLPVPIISIGNLSVGGTGKTPFTQYVADGLRNAGWRVAILSRGYRGNLRGRSAAVSDLDGTILISPEQSGDEPALLARSLPGIPVVVGKDRRVSARIAIERFQPDILILDDGFQYWQLARDLDIVLLDALCPFDNGHALPRGLLREPKRNLARAGLIVYTRAQGLNSDERTGRIREVRAIAPDAPVFFARHRPSGWRSLNSAAVEPVPRRAVVACGIAQPHSFAQSVREEGVEVLGPVIAFGDHQAYGRREFQQITGRMKDYGDAALVTTEKDASKIAASAFPFPAYALGVRVEIEEPERFWSALYRAATRLW